MKKFFYLLAIATTTMACGSEPKNGTKETVAEEGVKPNIIMNLEECTCGECEKCIATKEAEASIENYEALIAEIGDQPLSEVMNKRAYAMGANTGLQFKGMNEILNLDTDMVLEHALRFFIMGDVESEAFQQENMALGKFLYSPETQKYVQTWQKRKAFEDAGVTENLPELPEFYNKEMTREMVATIMGHGIGASCKDVDNFDWAWFVKGFNDSYGLEDLSTIEAVNAGLLLTTEEISVELMALDQEMAAKAQAKYEKMCEDNKAASEAWLAEVEKENGVQKTESGILYRIEREGDGNYPTDDTDVVEVHYKGTLCDGTVFDSSYDRGETTSFGLNQVIKGWTEGLKLINVGGKITLWIPSELAYGANNRDTIKPNSALKFEVELFNITKAEPIEATTEAIQTIAE